MKPIHRTLILAGLIAATGLTVYHFTTSPQRIHASEPGTPPAVEGKAESVVATRPAKENRAVATASNRPAPEVIPEGIGAKEWQQATALFNMLTSSDGEGIMLGALMKPADIEAITKALNLDPGASSTLKKRIEARNETLKQIGRDQITRYKNDAAGFKERMALTIIPEKDLSDQQKARLEQMNQQQKEDQKDFIAANIPWYKDRPFLASLHDALPAEQAAAFDGYATDQNQKKVELIAHSHASALGSSLQLDENQRNAIFEIYRTNEGAGSEEIMPLLNESQQATLKEHPLWGDWTK